MHVSCSCYGFVFASEFGQNNGAGLGGGQQGAALHEAPSGRETMVLPHSMVAGSASGCLLGSIASHETKGRVARRLLAVRHLGQAHRRRTTDTAGSHRLGIERSHRMVSSTPQHVLRCSFRPRRYFVTRASGGSQFGAVHARRAATNCCVTCMYVCVRDVSLSGTCLHTTCGLSSTSLAEGPESRKMVRFARASAVW